MLREGEFSCLFLGGVGRTMSVIGCADGVDDEFCVMPSVVMVKLVADSSVGGDFDKDEQWRLQYGHYY